METEDFSFEEVEAGRLEIEALREVAASAADDGNCESCRIDIEVGMVGVW